MVTRQQIVSEIMKLVPPQLVMPDRKPTIEELEKILNSEEPPARYHMAPDGSITFEKPHTVGDIADAVMRLLESEAEQGDAPEKPKHERAYYTETLSVLETLTKNGELRDYDDEMANRLEDAKDIVRSSMRRDGWK